MKGKKRNIKLTEDQRAELVKGHKTGKKSTFRQRCHYLLLSDQGFSMEQISEIHSISRISLGKWYTRYERDGLAGLATAKGQGRKTVLRIENQADAQRLEGWVADNAQNLRPVLAQVEEHFGVSICKRTLQRVLKKKTMPGNASEKARRASPTSSSTS